MDEKDKIRFREIIRFTFGQSIAYDDKLFEWFIENKQKTDQLQAENERLEKERDEYHDQYHLCEAKLLSHKSIIKQGQIAYEQLKGLAQKIVLCFPDMIPEDQEEIAFNIPAYVVEELREALRPEAKK